jgi:hypothetical protein
MNGNIFVNHETLIHGPNGPRSKEEIRANLLHVINHEIIHGTITSNYWKSRQENKDNIKSDEKYPFNRRL